MPLLFALLLMLAACAPVNTDSRGHVIDPDAKAQIHPGQTTRDEVMTLLGSPSTAASFGDETWYYISAKRENVAFLKPDTAEQEVLKIAFDAGGTVSSVETFDKEDIREIDAAKRTTPTEGHEMTVIEQMLGNLGRFNAPSNDRAGSINTSRGRR